MSLLIFSLPVSLSFQPCCHMHTDSQFTKNKYLCHIKISTCHRRADRRHRSYRCFATLSPPSLLADLPTTILASFRIYCHKPLLPHHNALLRLLWFPPLHFPHFPYRNVRVHKLNKQTHGAQKGLQRGPRSFLFVCSPLGSTAAADTHTSERQKHGAGDGQQYPRSPRAKAPARTIPLNTPLCAATSAGKQSRGSLENEPSVEK